MRPASSSMTVKAQRIGMFSPALRVTISASAGSASTAATIAVVISRPRNFLSSAIDDHLADAQVVDLAAGEPEADGVLSVGRLVDFVDDDAIVSDAALVHVEGRDHVERHVLLGRAWHGSSYQLGRRPSRGVAYIALDVGRLVLDERWLRESDEERLKRGVGLLELNVLGWRPHVARAFAADLDEIAVGLEMVGPCALLVHPLGDDDVGSVHVWHGSSLIVGKTTGVTPGPPTPSAHGAARRAFRSSTWPVSVLRPCTAAAG